MKQYKLPDSLDKWDHVSVVWHDAMTDTGGHNSDEFVENYKPCIRRSSGYVLCYDDEKIIIAHVDDREANSLDDGKIMDCQDITTVPVAFVRRIIRSRV